MTGMNERFLGGLKFSITRFYWGIQNNMKIRNKSDGVMNKQTQTFDFY